MLIKVRSPKQYVADTLPTCNCVTAKRVKEAHLRHYNDNVYVVDDSVDDDDDYWRMLDGGSCMRAVYGVWYGEWRMVHNV